MNIETLEALGLNVESLGDRIVDQAVHSLLFSSGFYPDDDEEVTYASRFQDEIGKQIKKAVDEKICALAEVHLVPRVGELIEQADMRITNQYGEPKSAPMTFKEYLAHRAENYMSEDVDHHGRSKAEANARGDGYNWRSEGPRLTVLMKLYIKDAMEKAAKAAVTDVNKEIAKMMSKAAREAIAKAAESVKVAVTEGAGASRIINQGKTETCMSELQAPYGASPQKAPMTTREAYIAAAITGLCMQHIAGRDSPGWVGAEAVKIADRAIEASMGDGGVTVKVCAEQKEPPAGRMCWFRQVFRGEWSEGRWLAWSTNHEEYDSGPGHFPAAIVEAPDGEVHVVVATWVSFSTNRPAAG